MFYSTETGQNTGLFTNSLGRRTRKDGRVTGPVRQAASWKRCHGAAKRSVSHSPWYHPRPLQDNPNDRGRFSVAVTVAMDGFVRELHLVFVCILFGLARFYAALPCHAAIVMRGLSLTAWKVHFILGLFFDLVKLLLCCSKQWRFLGWQYNRVKGDFRG